MVQVFGITKPFVILKQSARPVVSPPEVQNVDSLSSQIQQIVQRFSEGVLYGHVAILGKGITEDADVRSGSKIGCTEIPVLPEGEVVSIDGVGREGIGVKFSRSRVRPRVQDPPSLPLELRLGQVSILWIE